MNPTNVPEKPSRPRSFPISVEAIIGIGVTIGSLGLLCLLLGWAQMMRGVTSATAVWIPLGAVLFLLGAVVAGIAWSGKFR
ncbi:MAG: hypothetical protein V7609_1770 [Verrucomicrobiota bacterium]